MMTSSIALHGYCFWIHGCQFILVGINHHSPLFARIIIIIVISFCKDLRHHHHHCHKFLQGWQDMVCKFERQRHKPNEAEQHHAVVLSFVWIIILMKIIKIIINIIIKIILLNIITMINMINKMISTLALLTPLHLFGCHRDHHDH